MASLGDFSSPALVCYATQSGGTTLDTAAGGGNPFASALIDAASEQKLQLKDLPARLGELTGIKSNGRQVVECVGRPRLPTWQFFENLGRARERRCALVLVVSDYSRFTPDASLIGAARDERRIAAMLAQFGFSVTQGVGSTRQELTLALTSFCRRSARADIGIVYSTGHGVECNGIVYLLPGDYPKRDGFGTVQLARHAVSVPRMVQAVHASGQNLVFFAGCRTHVVDSELG